MTAKRRWVAAGLAALLACAGSPPGRADSGAIAGGAAAGVVLGGPRGSAKSFYYFTGFRDSNGNGVRDPDEIYADDFRIDITSSSWWSTSKMVTGLADRTALSTIVPTAVAGTSFASTAEGATTTIGTTIHRPMSDSGAHLHFALGEQVPVIIYSSNPEPVLSALTEATKGIRERRNLVNALGLLQGIERRQKEIDSLSKGDSLLAEQVARQQAAWKAAKATWELESTKWNVKEASSLGKAILVYQAITDNDATEARKEQASKIEEEYRKLLVQLLVAAGEPELSMRNWTMEQVVEKAQALRTAAPSTAASSPTASSGGTGGTQP